MTNDFEAKDIGPELLSIITKGIYKNPYDALREYVQNAIDAHAKNVEISFTTDLISVKDDGDGMDKETALKCKRLGISEKNPSDDVGFRGIGVYSSYDICDKLEIHTKSKGESSIISFDFQKMRNLLKEEEKRRISGEQPKLHLELVLRNSVNVTHTDADNADEHGTLVILMGINPSLSTSFSDLNKITSYLQNNVPVPFDGENFIHKTSIESMFREKDYRIVNLKLVYNGNETYIYRPYINNIFSNGGLFPPIQLDVEYKGRIFGFAWICINDARAALKNKELRGLLIKKHGFSVSDRSYTEPFFGRVVISRRITGEIIVQNDGLIPNAGRNDFEFTQERTDFLLAISGLAKEIDKKANYYQENMLADEQIDYISIRVVEIEKSIMSDRRNVDLLLELNTELDSLRNSFKLHKDKVSENRQYILKQTEDAIKKCSEEIKSILKKRKKPKEEEKQIRNLYDSITETLRHEKTLKEDGISTKSNASSITEVLERYDFESIIVLMKIINHIDINYLKNSVTEKEYVQFLADLEQFIEGMQ